MEVDLKMTKQCKINLKIGALGQTFFQKFLKIFNMYAFNWSCSKDVRSEIVIKQNNFSGPVLANSFRK